MLHIQQGYTEFTSFNHLRFSCVLVYPNMELVCDLNKIYYKKTKGLNLILQSKLSWMWQECWAVPTCQNLFYQLQILVLIFIKLSLINSSKIFNIQKIQVHCLLPVPRLNQDQFVENGILFHSGIGLLNPNKIKHFSFKITSHLPDGSAKTSKQTSLPMKKYIPNNCQKCTEERWNLLDRVSFWSLAIRWVFCK